MKKLKILQIILVIIFFIFIVFLLQAKNYTKKYMINDILVEESYNKQDKYYYFEFMYNDITLDFLVESKYKQHRGFVENIEVAKNDDDFCLIPKGKLNFIPLCYQEGHEISYHLVNEALKEKLPTYLFSETKKIDEYEGINVYNKNYNYLIWNYSGFYYLNNNESKKINILKKETYNINLVTYTKDYLVLADYDTDYTFNKFYTISFKNGSVKSYNLDYNIYFDSYFLGFVKNKAYLVDNKESRMYEFNASNGKLEKVKSKLLKYNEWENVNIKTLINNKQKFIYNSNYFYTLDNETLYLNYKNKDIKKKITSNVSTIVKTNNQDIFYIKNDALYHFNETTGEDLLLEYFEWNFNFENVIFIN